MAETSKALPSKQNGNESQTTHMVSRRWVSGWWVPALLCAGLVFGASSHAEAEPSGTPTANRVFFNCTFTTEGLQSILTISPTNLAQLNGTGELPTGEVLASYILIYVAENPNDGQKITGTTTYTGPILCTNSDTDDVVQTSPTTLIPRPSLGADSVDILGAEEASHLQYRPNFTEGVGDIEKCLCHTVASNTDCFLIGPPPLEPPPPPLE